MLRPGGVGWDDLAIWTGSVVRDGGHWRMFYTAVNSEGHGVYDQRIGSGHLRPTCTLDPGRPPAAAAHPIPAGTRRSRSPRRRSPYLAPLEGRSETWRDPLAIPDPDGDGWHLLITARSAFAGRNDDGVIAHAFGPTSTSWTMGPPLCEPGQGFGQLEVLQSKVIDGRWSWSSPVTRRR